MINKRPHRKKIINLNKGKTYNSIQKKVIDGNDSVYLKIIYKILYPIIYIIFGISIGIFIVPNTYLFGEYIGGNNLEENIALNEKINKIDQELKSIKLSFKDNNLSEKNINDIEQIKNRVTRIEGKLDSNDYGSMQSLGKRLFDIEKKFEELSISYEEIKILFDSIANNESKISNLIQILDVNNISNYRDNLEIFSKNSKVIEKNINEILGITFKNTLSAIEINFEGSKQFTFLVDDLGKIAKILELESVDKDIKSLKKLSTNDSISKERLLKNFYIIKSNIIKIEDSDLYKSWINKSINNLSRMIEIKNKANYNIEEDRLLENVEENIKNNKISDAILILSKIKSKNIDLFSGWKSDAELIIMAEEAIKNLKLMSLGKEEKN